MSVANYADDAAVRQIWAKVKTELGKKVNSTTLDDYSTTEQMQAFIATTLLDYMTADQISAAISTAISKVVQFKYSVVQTLPETGEEGRIYLVPSSQNETDLFDEYLWVDGKFEKIGSTQVDLSQYWGKNELTAITSAQLEEILV